MGDYGKLSNFNSKANFSMVRFGADTPITECELNEVQQIQDYKHKQLAKVIGDRFTKIGKMQYVSSEEVENLYLPSKTTYRLCDIFTDPTKVRTTGKWETESIFNSVWSGTEGSTLEFSFRGEKLTLVVQTARASGLSKVYLNDTLIKELDFFSMEFTQNVEILTIDNLNPNQTNTFKIECLGVFDENHLAYNVGRISNIRLYGFKIEGEPIYLDKIHLKDNDILVEGQPIHISEVVAPFKEGQTAYLKVSEKDIDKDSNIKSYGNEQSEETEDNTLLDPRLEGIETARRKQICYDLDVQDTLATHPKQTVEGELELNANKGDYVDNIAIEGETLVNLFSFDTTRTNFDDSIVRTYAKNDSWIINGTYTLYNFTDKNIHYTKSKLSDGSYIGYVDLTPNSCKVVELGEDERIYGCDFMVSEGWEGTTSNYTDSSIKLLVLEGNHTGKLITYFEGLKSVGQGDSIDILNFVKEGESLYDRSYDDSLIMDEYIEQNPNHQNFGTIVSNDRMCRSDEFIEVKPNTVYVLPYANGNVTQYNSQKELLRVENSVKYLIGGFTKNISIVELRTSNETAYIKVAMEKVHIGKVEIYESAKISNNKVTTTLRSLPNGVQDTIEKRGNKHYKIKRCGEYTITGNEGITMTSSTTLNVFNIPYALNSTKSLYLLCDKYQMLTSSGTKQGILYDYSNNRFRVTDDNFTSADNFVTELKSNPITVVYELETPIIEELPNFNPELFEGENTIILNSGVIKKDMNFNYYEYLVPVFEEDTTYIPLVQIHQGKVKDLRITDPNRVNYKMEGKDVSNGQFTKVIQTRQNGTVKRVSELSDKVGENYTKLTVQDYDDLGTTVILTEVYALDYDNEGDLIGQELIERC